jgi:23S rRNA (guanosine2251-2'-O)-methyltransferase
MSNAENIIAGVHAVSEAIRRRSADVAEILLQSDRQDKRIESLRAEAQQTGLSLRQVTREELDNLVTDRHQGVVAIMARAKRPLDEAQLLAKIEGADRPVLILVLDGVTDPHNLGACLRSADAAGVTAVVTPKDKAVGLTPVVRKVASGAAETIDLVTVTNLARCLKSLQDKGVWIVGTDDAADTTLYQQDLTGPLAIVMGSEGSGLRRLTRDCCDFLVSIPMAGELSSLNVSVATGVTLFEALRQRQS